MPARHPGRISDDLREIQGCHTRNGGDIPKAGKCRELGGQMRLTCPLCGPRDSREFTYLGDAALLARPTRSEDMFAYVHLRDNPEGPQSELWQHTAGCRAWLKVTRNTKDHTVLSVELVDGGHG